MDWQPDIKSPSKRPVLIYLETPDARRRVHNPHQDKLVAAPSFRHKIIDADPCIFEQKIHLLHMVAAGDRESGFSGVAPFSDIMMVKLKPAKAYLKSLYKIPQDAVCFQETDMAWGLQYLMSKAAAMRRPLVVCMTLGTNSGGHSGRGILDSMINSAAERYHMCVVTSTGLPGSSRGARGRCR